MNNWLRMLTVVGIALSLAMVGKCAGDALAHEGHGFKHANYPIGPCIGSRTCDLGISRWTIDKDGDGTADWCIDMIFTHGEMHVKDIGADPIKDNMCMCPGEE